jgi:uncharacterized protein (DUF1778 family)
MASAGRTKRRVKSTRKPSRVARLETRITKSQKALIERAAAYEGRTVTDFVVSTLYSAAKTVIEEHEVIRLNPEQSLAFVKKLLNPPPPNAALRRAARLHRQTVVSR